MSDHNKTTQISKAEQARINGAKSNGPISPEGKLRSSLNRLKHGRYSRYLSLLHIEDRKAFDTLIDDLVAQFLSKDHVEFRLITQLASVEWRKQRLDALDVAILDNEYAIQAAALTAAGREATQEQIAALARAFQEVCNKSQALHLSQRQIDGIIRARRETLSALSQLRLDFPSPERTRDLPFLATNSPQNEPENEPPEAA